MGEGAADQGDGGFGPLGDRDVSGGDLGDEPDEFGVGGVEQGRRVLG
jgi:hypothetical protein